MQTSRRGFIRSALAAVAGAAAGAMMPKTPVEKVVQVFSEVPNAGAGVFTFHNLAWIEDEDCPEGIIYLLPRGLADAVYRGDAHLLKV